jgi:pilus assembly protein Flp/PilA
MLTYHQQRISELQGEEKLRMTRIANLVWKLRIWKDTRGQDLIEYALMAGFVAVAAGAIMPGVASSISTIFSKISSTMSSAATQGS